MEIREDARTRDLCAGDGKYNGFTAGDFGYYLGYVRKYSLYYRIGRFGPNVEDFQDFSEIFQPDGHLMRC